MSLLVFQHHEHEPPAALGEILRNHGHRPRVVKLFAGEPLPPDLDALDGIVSMGGPMNPDQADKHPWSPGEMALLKQGHDAGLPVVGVCLGAQLIAAALGGKVAAMAQPEVGWGNVKLAFPGTMETLYQGIPWDTVQFHLHGQEVTQLPGGATPLASSKLCKTQAFKVGLRTYGFQYHFEYTKKDILAAARDEMARAAGLAADALATQTEQHYDGYRRLGNRLCETMALMLFPIDRRMD
jgi:GMP synthase (glutamine-hydrolysing)